MGRPTHPCVATHVRDTSDLSAALRLCARRTTPTPPPPARRADRRQTRTGRAKPQSRKAAELSCLCTLAAWRDLAPAAPRRDAHTTTGSPNPERHRRRPVSPGVMPNAPSGPRPRREPNPERHRLHRVTSSSPGSTLRGQVVVAARSMREAREIVAKIKPLARLGCLGAARCGRSPRVGVHSAPTPEPRPTHPKGA